MTHDQLKDHLDAAIRDMNDEDIASINASQERARRYDRAALAPDKTAADRDRISGYAAIARGSAVQRIIDATREKMRA